MDDHHPQAEVALAAWIRAARRQRDLSQVELAEQLGVRQSSVSQWERGSTAPATPHLLALLRIFPDMVTELIADGGTVSEAPAEAQSA
jgi:transcriptional regulator with XRE-family HTH domain